jgi:hypothetical protein
LTFKSFKLDQKSVNRKLLPQILVLLLKFFLQFLRCFVLGGAWSGLELAKASSFRGFGFEVVKEFNVFLRCFDVILRIFDAILRVLNGIFSPSNPAKS